MGGTAKIRGRRKKEDCAARIKERGTQREKKTHKYPPRAPTRHRLHNQAAHLVARPFPISIVLLPRASTDCVPDHSRRSWSRRRRRSGRGRRNSEV
ncbi:hypothetical protein B0H10DRAFT_2135424 [Mycena sp. CBHHK59/15]|nr:hypothetical protein B0H10DRAFT_2135424 [Mycena sp. CBHHK59/15]